MTNFLTHWERYEWGSNPRWLELRFIDYRLFYVPLKNFSLIRRRHHYRWRAVKFRPMLGAQGFWAGEEDFYRATPAATRGLGFSGLIRTCRTAPIQSPFTTHKGVWKIYFNPDPHRSPFSPPLRHARGCWKPWSWETLWFWAQSTKPPTFIRLQSDCSLFYLLTRSCM
jgi:hypothetical protein